MVTLASLIFKRRRPRHALATLAAAIMLPLVIVALLAVTGVVSRLEGYTIDARFDRRGDLPAPKDIVVVGIDAQTATYFNQWPLSRALFADAITHLHDNGAAMIVLDAPFTNTSMTGTRAQSQAALAKLPDWQRAQIPAGATVNEDDTFIKALHDQRADCCGGCQGRCAVGVARR